jgi:hypothetical protein
VDGFPDAKELDRVAVAQPIGNEEITIFRLEHVRQRNEVVVPGCEDGDGCPLNLNGGFSGDRHGDYKAKDET